ncbi:MAG: hypothetical protein PHW82_09725 [Bacteroidales bacterium]|nr:hypothetical protein [Bacteroidales bacterium]
MLDTKTNKDTLGSIIISKLPYRNDFLFVNEISYLDSSKIIGHYTFRENAAYYKSHFSHRPETPGVLLIETMGQIGMVSHLIFLTGLHLSDTIFSPMLSTVESSFFKTVSPEQKLTIIGEKIYYRKNVLKSQIKLFDSNDELCVLCVAQLSLKYE